MSRVFCVGDIHGDLRGLLQVLKLSNLDKKNDTLIVIGDVADGWPETPQVIEELLTIRNLVPIMGNHDWWAFNYLRFGYEPDVWLYQGGKATFDAYQEHPEFMKKHRENYFSKCHFYYIYNKNAFVHGGYTSMEGLGNDSQDTYMWDRSLWNKALSAKKDQLNLTKMYKKVWIGHTSLGKLSLPQKGSNVWNLDCGGGWEGALCLMNIETEEYFMSDSVKDLYPEIKGR